MSNSLVPVLHNEERSIIAELRASRPFQRLEAIRRLLALYDEQPSVAAGLDMPPSTEADRGSAEVIHFTTTTPSPAATPAAASPSPVYTPQPATYAPPPATSPAPAAAQPSTASASIPMPGPAPQAAAVAEAAVADVVMRAPNAETETSSVVSSVRAALLGIGKG